MMVTLKILPQVEYSFLEQDHLHLVVSKQIVSNKYKVG